MCTVTFYPIGENEFLFNSSRDETPNRNTRPPQWESDLFFPKDRTAGGSWIGLNKSSRLCCILNGAFEKHKRKLPYRRSRGLVLKDFLSCESVKDYYSTYDFDNIEPFTLLVLEWEQSVKLYEIVWDGLNSFFEQKTKQPHVWSSSTLYDKEMRAWRESEFATYVIGMDNTVNYPLEGFHLSENMEMPSRGIKMKRERVETVSLSSIRLRDGEIDFKYEDFQTGSVSFTRL